MKNNYSKAKPSSIGLLLLFLFNSCNLKTQTQPNILFIAVDDLRLQTGSYGKPIMHTPNIDKLASEGVQFNRAYCQVPVCGASRASLLSSIRPASKRFVSFAAKLEKDVPTAQSLIKTFRNGGYETVSIGKVYHDRNDNDSDWVRRYKDHEMADYQILENQLEADSIRKHKPKGDIRIGAPFEAAEVHDTMYSDGKLTTKALKELEILKDSENPFFLSVGYFRPHLPFISPKKYWDLYNRGDIELADNPFQPKNAPKIAKTNWGELRRMYTGIPAKGPVSDSLARTLIHAYYASVSFVDAQVGMLLDALDEHGLRENTIVVLWGDHGWFLGEHGMWCKHSTFHLGLNAPLIISANGYSKGTPSESLAEFIDIYPTLCDIVGLETPGYIDGTSLTPILKNPENEVKDAVYCRFAKAEAVITKQYSYTEWINYKNNNELIARMLYDLKIDSDENINISELPESKELVDSLSNLLYENRLKVENKVFE